MKKTAQKIITIIMASLLALGMLPSGTVFATEGSSEQFGTVELYSSYEMGQKLTDSYYYSDEWFLADTTERNDALALLSMQLTAAAVDGKADGLGIVFLKKLGFTEAGYVPFDMSDFYGCSYTWGKKTITSGGKTMTVIAVQIQSASFVKDEKKSGWTQNFMVNGEPIIDEHDALSKAAGEIIDDIAALGKSGNVRYWITGQSRGGAIANLIAAHLSTDVGVDGGDIFAYTFEAPAVVEESAIVNPGAYGYIHNYLCSDDIVTKIPMWGMTRYGNDYQLNTEETTEKLPEELEKLGSGLSTVAKEAAEAEEDTINNLIAKIMVTLNKGVPDRADYSATQMDKFKDDNGQEITMQCVYQDVLAKMMGIVFGDGIGTIDLNELTGKIGDLLPIVFLLAKAQYEEESERDASCKDYYNAACRLKDFISEVGLNIPLETEEIYALLKLAAPLLVDASTYGPEATEEDALSYIQPVITLYGGRQMLTLSHHFESVIARLKVLAPEPELKNQDIIIEEPQAGDDTAKAPAEILKWKDEQNASWMTASAEWESKEETLADDSIQYLNVTLTTVGHSIPEDFSLTLNGKEPAEDLEITYEKGVYSIRASFLFVIGEVESVTVTFADPVHAETPEPVQVAKGMKLKSVLQLKDYGVVEDNAGYWKFNGWFDQEEGGQLWKDVIAEDDLTLYADWTQVINQVEISFQIPNVGDSFEMPSVPEGKGYKLLYSESDEDTGTHVTGDNWETVTAAETVGPYTLSVFIVPVSEGIEFLTGTNKWGDEDYAGTAFINGEEVEFIYSEEGGYLEIEYFFTAKSSVEYTILEGDLVRWILGSDEGVTVTVKRTQEDNTCFDHFMNRQSHRVFINSLSLSEEAYEAKAGSTIITINKDYLNNYESPEKVTLRIFFDDGVAETTLSIVEKAEEESQEETTPSVDTGDRSRADLWIILLAAALICLLTTGTIALRKKEITKDK